MRNATDITVVLDRSGSMGIVQNDTKGGFDAFVQEQAKSPVEAVLTLVQFDTIYEFVHESKPIKNVPPLDFQPRGATALLDALGRAITETGKRLKDMDEAKRPERVVFVIITDGEENSSHEYKREQILDMIKHQREAYKWEFVFLGANQDSFAQAGSIGIPINTTMNYGQNKAGVKGMFAATALNLRRMSETNDPLAMSYSAEQRLAAMGKEDEEDLQKSAQ